MKAKKLQIIKICLLVVAVVFPVSICILPSLNTFQTNFWIWVGVCSLFIIYNFFHKYVSGT